MPKAANPIWIVGPLVGLAVVGVGIVVVGLVYVCYVAHVMRGFFPEPVKRSRPVETVVNVAPATETVVNISADGACVIDGETLSVDEVEQALRRIVTDNPQNHCIVIRADKRVRTERVIDLMDHCKNAGVTDYKITTAD